MRTNRKIVLTVLFLFAICLPFEVLAQEDTLRIYWCDVEGGAATLIVTPMGESVLLDAGLPGERDPGRIHSLATKVAGLERIDHMISTHFDLDHYGGVADLSKLLPIVNYYDPGVPEKHDPKYVVPYIEASKGKRKVVKAGDEITLIQDEEGPPLRLYCYGAAQRYLDAPDGTADNEECGAHEPMPPDTTENANSTVFLLSYGPFKFLDAADLSWELEKDLVCPRNPIGTVDVFQVDHHGLDVSNNPVLIHSVQPRVAVMNNGYSKGCGTRTVQTLRLTPSIEAVYQLHKNLPVGGNAPPAYIANLEKECSANHVELSVSLDGKHYTVTIPANGHRHSYATKG